MCHRSQISEAAAADDDGGGDGDCSFAPRDQHCCTVFQRPGMHCDWPRASGERASCPRRRKSIPLFRDTRSPSLWAIHVASPGAFVLHQRASEVQSVAEGGWKPSGRCAGTVAPPPPCSARTHFAAAAAAAAEALSVSGRRRDGGSGGGRARFSPENSGGRGRRSRYFDLGGQLWIEIKAPKFTYLSRHPKGAFEAMIIIVLPLSFLTP